MTFHFYDTEFLDDGDRIRIISIGIAASDGRTYYAINADMDATAVHNVEWLRTNVLRHLPTTDLNGRLRLHFDRSHPDVKPRAQIADEVRAFLTADGHRPELWGYYSAYDHVALAQLLWGPMNKAEDWFPYRTNDLAQEIARLGITEDDLPVQDPSTVHHALRDAEWNREVMNLIYRRQMEQAR